MATAKKRESHHQRSPAKQITCTLSVKVPEEWRDRLRAICSRNGTKVWFELKAAIENHLDAREAQA